MSDQQYHPSKPPVMQQTTVDMSSSNYNNGADDYLPQQDMQMMPSTLTTETVNRQQKGVHSVLTSLQKNQNSNSGPHQQ